MKQKLVWSIGLYTLDFVVYEEDKGVLTSVLDLPPIFPNGDVRDYIQHNYEYDSRMESGLFKVFMGLEVRDPQYTKKFMSDIAQEFGFNEERVLNIEDLRVGAKDLFTLLKEYNNSKNQF